MKRKLFRIVVLVAFLISLGLFIFFKNHEGATNVETIAEAVVSGPPEVGFIFHAVGTSGSEWRVSTGTYTVPLHVLKLKKEDFVSCELERVSGNGILKLDIFHKTNLVISVELPADKRIIKLKRDRWSYDIH